MTVTERTIRFVNILRWVTGAAVILLIVLCIVF